MSARTCLILASLLGFLAVLFGAFGAHALNDTGALVSTHGTEPRMVSGQELSNAYKYLMDYQTGVRYHMWHALALFGIGLMMRRTGRRASTSIAAYCFLFGTIMFSGSLYMLAILGPGFQNIPLGLTAATGGTILLLGWATLVIACIRID